MFAVQLRHLLIGTSFAVLASAGVALADNPPAGGSTTPAAETTATTTTAAAPATQTDEKAKEDPIICKQMEAPTGSRMGGKKVCRPASEWRAQTESAKNTTEGIQRQGAADNPSGN